MTSVVTAEGTVSETVEVHAEVPAGTLSVTVALVFPAVGHAAMKSDCEGLAALQTDVVQDWPESCRGASRQSARLPSMIAAKRILGFLLIVIAFLAFGVWVVKVMPPTP
jgi:hypothetical protein